MDCLLSGRQCLSKSSAMTKKVMPSCSANSLSRLPSSYFLRALIDSSALNSRSWGLISGAAATTLLNTDITLPAKSELSKS